MNDKRSKLERNIQLNEDLSSSSTSSFCSEDETDNKVLKPIKDYLYNRRELAKQLFMSVKKEKIKMMLPQSLKKANMDELEDLCANEVSGMSKTRIISILNGKPMINSSDTSDSDDSGPSLEIISDTEAWITDSEPPTEQKDNITKLKMKSKKNKKHSGGNSSNIKNKSSKSKGSNKNVDLTKVKNEQIKTEKESGTQNQQGESLLDLLELEMRARAIRALIRKEEDVIPSAESSSTSPNTSSKQKTSSDVNRKELNKNLDDTYKVLKESEVFQNLNSCVNEDEDVVLVIKPTPTIELSSSDSENENSSGATNKSDNKVGRTDVIIRPANSDNKNNESILSEDNSGNKISNKDQTDSNYNKEKSNMEKSQESEVLCNEKSDKEKSNLNILPDTTDADDNNKNSKTPSTDDRLNDYDEIIDLDDYSNDMDDTDNENSTNGENSKKSSNTIENCSLNSAETWATRYYQTDNVQNVIKESKIQSEIRKRFRERQKLSKLSSSSKDASKKSSIVEKAAEFDEIKPTGSVEEYLALKNLTDATGGNLTSPVNDNSKMTDNDSNSMENSLNDEKSDECTDNMLIDTEKQSANTTENS